MFTLHTNKFHTNNIHNTHTNASIHIVPTHPIKCDKTMGKWIKEKQNKKRKTIKLKE